SHVADEQRVSGQRSPRRRRLLFVGNNQTDALRRVSRCSENVDAQFADAQLETIANSDMRKSCACFFSDVDSRTRACGQLFVSRDEVGVQMGLEDVANLKLLLLRRFQVDLDVTLRIDDDSFAFRFEEIRSMRQTTQIKLFEVHGPPPLRGT